MPEPALSYSRAGRIGQPTLVLLHGFLGGQEDWRDLIDGLGDSCDAIAIDLPGHGASTDMPERHFSFDGISHAISDLLATLGVNQYCLAGYSMGGRIALYHATRNRDRIQSLVLISANPGIESKVERRERYDADMRLSADLESGGLSAFIERWYSQPLFASLKKRADFETIMSRRSHGSAGALARALRGFSVGIQPPLWKHLAGITAPVLCVAGELDQKYVGLATRTADLCGQGKLCIISDAGHAVHLEQPEELALAVRPMINVHA
ncbi:MAG: 2-succinyl-6-hydroxy-2,4-cyclohexadiene-1-carboxylate synthase [candidate division Zixibacteria bacterium]|nr:2-succinyl-6-hydroxy-2,4-cyclohexadiene-1-carboxylate synthase [candidate division Zixibacteria bacterium]